MELNGFIFWLMICVAPALGVMYALHKVGLRTVALPVTANWIEELSVERYRPMLRILDEEEFRMAASQPACTSGMMAELRRERCRIFRGYLRSLRDDFARVSLALKLLMAQAGQDRPDLASLLIRSRLQFGLGMALVEVRLALFRCGLGTVDAGSLLKTFDSLRVELRGLVPSSAMMAG